MQDFFSPLIVPPGNVAFIYSHTGRPSGEAFVKFTTPADAKTALAYHKRMLGQRYIEVFPGMKSTLWCVIVLLFTPPFLIGSESDFAKAAALTQATFKAKERDYPVLRLRGLPYSATTQDIANFFHVRKHTLALFILS